MESSSTQFPAQFWGLDPVFYAHPRLYIRDILQLQEIQGYRGVYKFCSHPITNVDIQGVVVRVIEKNKFFKYTLDDGTGVINCTNWKHEDNSRINQLDLLQDSLPIALIEKLNEVKSVQEKLYNGYNLGDLLHVRGKLKSFRDDLEISTQAIVHISDPNKETERMLLMPILYGFYNKAPTLPHGLAGTHGDIDELCYVFELETALMTKIISGDLKTISKHSALELDITDNKEGSMPGKDILSKVLENLKNAGHIFRQSTCEIDPVYVVTAHSSDLKQKILDTIKSWTKVEGNCYGCPVNKISDNIRKNLQYSNVSSSVVQQCLEKLESDSDIISVADKRYILA